MQCYIIPVLISYCSNNNNNNNNFFFILKFTNPSQFIDSCNNDNDNNNNNNNNDNNNNKPLTHVRINVKISKESTVLIQVTVL